MTKLFEFKHMKAVITVGWKVSASRANITVI